MRLARSARRAEDAARGESEGERVAPPFNRSAAVGTFFQARACALAPSNTQARTGGRDADANGGRPDAGVSPTPRRRAWGEGHGSRSVPTAARQYSSRHRAQPRSPRSDAKRSAGAASVTRSSASDALCSSTISETPSRSSPPCIGDFNRLAPLASPETFPRSLVNAVTTSARLEDVECSDHQPQRSDRSQIRLPALTPNRHSPPSIVGSRGARREDNRVGPAHSLLTDVVSIVDVGSRGNATGSVMSVDRWSDPQADTVREIGSMNHAEFLLRPESEWGVLGLAGAVELDLGARDPGWDRLRPDRRHLARRSPAVPGQSGGGTIHC